MEAGHSHYQGAIGTGKEFATAVARHVRARWSLFAVEGREAARHVGITAGFGAAAACSLCMAYIFFALSIGFAVAWLCDAIAGVWVLVMLGTGAAHVVLAVVFVLALRKRLSHALFPATREEFRKDFE